MPDNHTDAVKRLTDDEVANIRFDLANSKPSSSPTGLFRQHCEGLLNEHDALCATVRALRAEIRGIRRGFPEWAAEWDDLKRTLRESEDTNTALREQLAQTEAARDQLSAALSVRDEQLAQREQEWKAFENLGKRVEADLRAQLAQVTQERDELRKCDACERKAIGRACRLHGGRP